MNRKVVIFCAFALASILMLCAYPLEMISETHLGDTQILFYAFASVALVSLPFLYKQASRWRPHTLILVCFALISATANTLLQYVLLQGDTLIVVGVLCVTFSMLMLFRKTEPAMLSSFVVSVAVIVSAILMISLFSNGLSNHWTEWGAALVAVLFFWMVSFNKHSVVIPLASKLSVSFIGSTWIVGMVTIFSERFSSYMEDNAVSFSVAYGLIFLLPIMLSVLYVLSSQKSVAILLWLPLLLLTSISGLLLTGAITYASDLLWPIGLLLFSVFLQLFKLPSNLKSY